MTREELIAAAEKLTPPPAESLAEYGAAKDKAAAEVTRKLNNRPDIIKLVGPGGVDMMEANHRNHFRFMESLFAAYNPTVLVDTTRRTSARCAASRMLRVPPTLISYIILRSRFHRL